MLQLVPCNAKRFAQLDNLAQSDDFPDLNDVILIVWIKHNSTRVIEIYDLLLSYYYLTRTTLSYPKSIHFYLPNYTNVYYFY